VLTSVFVFEIVGIESFCGCGLDEKLLSPASDGRIGLVSVLALGGLVGNIVGKISG